MSQANPTANPTEFKQGDRVAYVEFDGTKQLGTVSSVNQLYVFVRFDAQVQKFGWGGATSQSCDPKDLIRILTRKEFEDSGGMISGGEALITKAEFPELFEALDEQTKVKAVEKGEFKL